MRAKKEYLINTTLSIRLTEKAGVTDEVLDFLNSQDPGKVSQEVFKALKYWIRTQGANDRIRKAIEDEAIKMESKLARYGENRGPYKKHDEVNEVEMLRKEINRLKAERKGNQQIQEPDPDVKPVKASQPKAVSIHTKSDAAAYYEDEIFGAPVREKKGNPMEKALKSIPKLG